MRATFTLHAPRLTLVLALVGGLASTTWPQAPAAESGPAATTKNVSKAAAPIAARRTAAKPESGPSEGIKIHGHWTIEIRKADGSSVKRYQFENMLTASGAGQMVLLVHGNSAVQSWGFRLVSVGALDPPGFGTSSGAGRLNSTLSGATVALNGSIEVNPPSPTEITAVQTINSVFPLISGSQASQQSFTSHTLAPPIPLSAGRQIVTVNLVISFS